MDQTFDLKGGIKYPTLPLNAKIFFTMFILIMGAGYILALMNIIGSLGFDLQNIIEHFAGSATDPIALPPMDFPTLATTTHLHMISMGTMAFLLGWIFLFTRTFSVNIMAVLYFLFFGVIFTDTCSFWLVRYVTEYAVYLMVISGMIMGACIGIMIFVPLYEMWLKKDKIGNNS